MSHPFSRFALLALFALLSLGSATWAAPLSQSLLDKANAARVSAGEAVRDHTQMIVIDYTLPSGEPRFYHVLLSEQTSTAYLVAHGLGSDRDHDGLADLFSNVSGSKMTSLGRFVTLQIYTGRHGLSLKLRGLDQENNLAEARAIVIHGADYVSPDRRKMGRSWGCPALENSVAKTLIPNIADGVFLYAVGPDAAPTGG